MQPQLISELGNNVNGWGRAVLIRAKGKEEEIPWGNGNKIHMQMVLWTALTFPHCSAFPFFETTESMSYIETSVGRRADFM